jgi:phosphoribosylanthranilate isomerase
VSLWIKICANTSLADAQLAAEAGADAVGFVFAPSTRRVTPDEVAQIVPHLPANVEKIGVFVDTPLDQVIATVENCKLTGVQLHVEIDGDAPARLREHFGPALRILRVVHFGPNAEEQVAALSKDPNIDAMLVDSRTATAVGGTGVAFDWEAARRGVFAKAGRQRLVVAGGLRPDNVAAAIAKLAPWGVDVASGVESSPGQKDRAKVCGFVANARAALNAK